MVNTQKFITQAIAEIKTAAGNDKVVMALSGGVDSSVCAALAARAIGDRLIPIYIDTGLMRKGETERIKTIFGNIQLQVVDAGDEFLNALKGVPTRKPRERQLASGSSGSLSGKQKSRARDACCRERSTRTGSRARGV